MAIVIYMGIAMTCETYIFFSCAVSLMQLFLNQYFYLFIYKDVKYDRLFINLYNY